MRKRLQLYSDTTYFQRDIRDYSLDNIRFLLIAAVVFAHFLEICAPFPGSRLLYKLIYAFHMPAFIFLFGYNIRYSPQRIVCRWCIPYVVFQSLYILFTRVVLKGEAAFQYTTPWWLLWYMLVCTFYQLLLPLYDVAGKGRQAIALLCVWVIALLAGFDNSVGYPLSLSRFFVFQPWFLLGYYCRQNSILQLLSFRRRKRLIWVLASAVVICLSVPLFLSVNIPNGLLYGANSYANCAASPWMRPVVMLLALGWVIFLFLGLKPLVNRKITVITAIGQNTWPVFLLHGFLVKAIPVYWPELLISPWLVALVSCAILLLLGNKWANRAVYYLGFTWLEKFLREDQA